MNRESTRSRVRRWTTSAVLLLGSVSMLAGCGASGNTGSAPSKKPIVLSFWNPATDKPTIKVMDFLIKQFEKTHPGIIVKDVPVSNSNHYVKYTTAMASGSPPDVIMTYGYGHIPVWAADNLTQPLNSYIKEFHLHLPTYWPVMEQAMQHGGKIWGVPQQIDEPMLLWNKAMFKAAGLNPNQPPTTIAQLTADEKKLTIIKNGHLVQAGFVPADRWGLNIWVRYFGGAWFNPKTSKFQIDTARNIQAFTWLRQIYKMLGGVGQVSAFENGNKIGNAFFAGQSAMEIGGEWVPGEITSSAPHLQYGVAPVPVAAGFAPGSLTYMSPGDFFVLPKGIPHPHAAAEFLVWMASPYAINYFCQHADNLPPTPSSAIRGGSFWKAAPQLQPWLAELTRAGDHGTGPVSNTPIYDYWTTTRSTMEQEIISGKVSPAKGLAELQSTVSQYQSQYLTTHPGW